MHNDSPIQIETLPRSISIWIQRGFIKIFHEEPFDCKISKIYFTISELPSRPSNFANVSLTNPTHFGSTRLVFYIFGNCQLKSRRIHQKQNAETRNSRNSGHAFLKKKKNKTKRNQKKKKNSATCSFASNNVSRMSIARWFAKKKNATQSKRRF